MSISKIKMSGKRLFVAVASLALVAGWGLASTSAALADSNEVVSIKGTNYEVNHNGDSPYVTVNGVKYYLQDNKVVFMGVTYTASGEGDHHEGDRHEGDRHDRHEGDKHDSHHEKDHHGHHDHNKD
jgi:hypothetical protein